MTRSFRRASFVLAAIAVVGSAAHARPDADERGFKYKLLAAVDYIAEKNWSIAIPHLQKLVDIKEDVFVQLPHKTPDGKESLRYVSVKTEANRLIGTLPEEGLEFYRLVYGAEALGMLKEAGGDPVRLSQLARRFRHTDAGQAAFILLAFSRGQLR